MYRFESIIEGRDLDKRYKAIYAKADLKKKWDDEVVGCPELARTLPDGIAPTDMLTMKFEKLVEVYLRYRQVFNRLTIDRQAALKNAAKKVFDYDSCKEKIKNFLMNANNGFRIYNCVYCDLHDVRAFGEGNRQFVTEHILDKGNCPLVGLSLYNFCPACNTCNTNLKGTKKIGTNEVQMKKLSPTSRQYDFQHQVKFVFIEMPEAVGRIQIDFGHQEWYEIDFEYKDDDYREVTKLFELKVRYNKSDTLLFGMELRDKLIKNRGIDLKTKALLEHKSEEQVWEDIFLLKYHRKVHSQKLKLMEDLILEEYNRIVNGNKKSFSA